METRPIGQMVRLHTPIRLKQAAVHPPNAFSLGDNRARHQTDKNFLDLHYRSRHRNFNRHHNLKCRGSGGGLSRRLFSGQWHGNGEVISTAQGALEKPFQRVLNGLPLQTPLDNDTSGTTVHVPLVALAAGGLCEGPRLVHLNTSQLRQLFLIGSTIEYTDKGVKAESRAMPVDHPPTASHRTMDMVDTGVGIASEDQFRILDLFFQAGWATAQSGTGLGLSICRQYTKLTGRIVLEGTLGKESRFCLELAVRRADTGEVAAARNEGKRIIGLEPRITGASHLNRRKPMEELAGARRCISTVRVRRASRKGQRAGCLNVSDLGAATYLDELASASYGRAGGCAPHPAPGMRKGWQNCTSKRLSVWFAACRGVSPRFRSARTHIAPARSLGKPGPAARCGAAIRRSPASEDRVTLPAEAMAIIPEELRNKTIDALILLDTEQSMGTVSSNPERDTAFGEALVDRCPLRRYTHSASCADLHNERRRRQE